MKEISEKSYSFIPVYRKEQTHVIGYVNSKAIIMNYLVLAKNEVIPLKKLVKGKIFNKAVHIYCDAVAIEALGVLENSKSHILLISEKTKHKSVNKAEGEEAASVISVY